MRGRTRGSGDGEEKRLMKKEDFREKTAFSIYIVCLIKIFDSGKGAEHMSEPRNFFCVVLLCCIFVFCLGYLQDFFVVFFLVCRRNVYDVRTTLECRHSFVVFFLFFWSNL